MAARKKAQEEVIDFNAENEMAIISAMMKKPELRIRLSRELEPKLFFGKRHRIIFKILQDLAREKLKFDLDSFVQLAKKRDFGGVKYLKDVEEYFDASKNIDFHIKILRQDALKISLRLGPVAEMVTALEDPSIDLIQLTEIYRKIGTTIATRVDPGLVEASEKAVGIYNSDLKERLRGKKRTFVPLGLEGIDDFLNEGQARAKVSVFFGRPRTGKSTLVTSLISDKLRKAVEKHEGNFADIRNDPEIPRHLICPLEMGRDACLDLIVANMAGVRGEYLVKFPHLISKMGRSRIQAILNMIKETGLINFLNKPGLTLADLPPILSTGRYSILWFDLWEKMVRDKSQEKIAERLDETQRIAQEFDVHCTLVHQARRSAEKRSTGRPTLDELKNSGAYEEVADLVLGLNRVGMSGGWDAEIERLETIGVTDVHSDCLEIGILKQRRGPQIKRWFVYKFEGKFNRVGEFLPDLNFWPTAGESRNTKGEKIEISAEED